MLVERKGGGGGERIFFSFFFCLLVSRRRALTTLPLAEKGPENSRGKRELSRDRTLSFIPPTDMGASTHAWNEKTDEDHFAKMEAFLEEGELWSHFFDMTHSPHLGSAGKIACIHYATLDSLSENWRLEEDGWSLFYDENGLLHKWNVVF